MEEIPITLVADPALRQSLRNLYPEYHPTVQAYLIAEPGAPLPALVDTSLPLLQDTGTLERSLLRSIGLLQRLHPEMGWTVVPQLKDRRPRRSHRMVCKSPAAEMFATMCALPDDSITEFRRPTGKQDTTDLPGGDVTLTRHGGSLRVQRIGHGWSLDLTTPEGLSLEVYSDPISAGVFRAGMEEILADGTGDNLSVARTKAGVVPRAIQTTVVAGMYSVDRAPLREKLLTRWRALATDDDRARVAQFWLGHPHPILAAAGMATLPSTSQLRR